MEKLVETLGIIRLSKSQVSEMAKDLHSQVEAFRTRPLDAGPPGKRCRTHYAANLLSATPKNAWGWVKALLQSVDDQPDADAVHAQFDRILDALADKLPAVAEHLDVALTDILAFTSFPKPHLAPDLVQQPRND